MIEAAQVRMVAYVASDDFTDITPDVSENEAAEKEPPTEVLTRKNGYNGTLAKKSKVPKTVDTHGGDEHSVSPCV